MAAGLVAAAWRRARFGVANAVTLARVVGTCWVGALTLQAATGAFDDADRTLTIAIAVGSLVLDGLDGWVARVRGEVTAFGARFDMETDAALLVFLSLCVPLLGVAGW